MKCEKNVTKLGHRSVHNLKMGHMPKKVDKHCCKQCPRL